MKILCTIIFIMGSYCSFAQPVLEKEYDRERRLLVNANEAMSFAADDSLSQDEKLVDRYLQSLKDSVRKKSPLAPSINFYHKKQFIEQSRLYSFLSKMPKGGLLHIHTKATTQAAWVVDTLVQLQHAYVYWGSDPDKKGTIEFKKQSPGADYFLASDLNKKYPKFREELIALLTLGAEDASNQWKEFGNCFGRIGKFTSYEPMFIPYYKKGLEDLIADGVQYVEIRAGLSSKLYSLDKPATASPEKNTRLFLALRKRLKDQYPDFDMKLIYAAQRAETLTVAAQELDSAYVLRKRYPDFIIGFDLIGDESAGKTTEAFKSLWVQMNAKSTHYDVNMPLYLHDGESDWRSDTNLVDAVLLGSRRIGHGINLYYFPALQQEVIERDIALEVCPISNQVLGYVPDLRIHPAISYINRGINISINSDDPGIFNYVGLSYDFWEATVAWDLSLKELKRLALNSLTYSAIGNKPQAIRAWQAKWDTFIRLHLLKANAKA